MKNLSKTQKQDVIKRVTRAVEAHAEEELHDLHGLLLHI
jgi:phenylpyruvate tautomerase PptA (4-oxalocrotonate tautomerase family)